MVHWLILCVLIVIALALSPWLLGLAAAAVAAFGIWIVVLGAALAVAIVIGAVWGVASSMRNSDREAAPIAGERTTCPSCQAEVSAGLVHCDNCHARL